MLEDIASAITEYEKQSTAKQCEAVIHHLDNTVRYARQLQARAHGILERRIQEERVQALQVRGVNFPPAQQIGAK